MDFDCRLDGRTIRCTLVPSRDLSAPLLVASFIGPTPITTGGTLERQTGGLSEIRLPDLAAGTRHEIAFEATGWEEMPVNRAFLPLGAWLRLADEMFDASVRP